MGETKQGPDWVCVNKKADWQARDSQGEFIYDDHLWVVGGWYTPQTPNPRDVWKSPDGKQWTRTVEVAPWEHSDLSASMVFKGKMWFMGGRKLPGAENSNKVWSSTDGAEWYSKDGKNWTELKSDVIWKSRHEHSAYVFKDKLWVAGGHAEPLNSEVWTLEVSQGWFGGE